VKKLKVGVYVDGANMWFTQKSLGWVIDWRKAVEFVKENFAVRGVYYYNALKKGDKKTKIYLEGLEKKLGFIVRSKELKRIETDNGYVYKGNFDVEMAIDMILEVGMKETIDGVVIFSGDSDFAYLADVLKKRLGKKVIVFSSNKFLSWELRERADWAYILNKLTRLAKDVKNG